MALTELSLVCAVARDALTADVLAVAHAMSLARSVLMALVAKSWLALNVAFAVLLMRVTVSVWLALLTVSVEMVVDKVAISVLCEASTA